MRFEVQLNVLAALTMFLAIPLSMFGGSPEDYTFIVYPMFLFFGICFSTLMASLLSIANIAMRRFEFDSMSRYFSCFFALWVVTAGIFLPLSVSTGMLDPEVVPVNKLNFSLSIVIVGLLSLFGFTNRRGNILFFVLLVFSITLVFSLVTICLSPDIEEDDSAFLLSSKRNIFVLSFDGLPGTVINQLLEENAEYTEDFKDFVVFRNAIAQSPATSASLIRDLFGDLDYKALGENQDEVVSALKGSEMFDKLPLNTVENSYQGWYAFGKGIRWNAVKSRQGTFDFFAYPIGRVWTNRAVRLLHWKEIRKKVTPFLLEEGFQSKLANSAGPAWDQLLVSTKLLFDELIERLASDDSELSLRYMHFAFTHFPVDFDENCSFRSDDKEWFVSAQNYEGLLAEGKCAIRQFFIFIKKLKEIGVYENSLIVLKSDHGKPAHYFPNYSHDTAMKAGQAKPPNYFSEYPDNTILNGHPQLGYNRYRPMLMIKDIGVTKPKITYKDELVLLGDLAQTICLKVGLVSDCSVFPGLDLLGPSLDSDAPYYLYVAKDSHSIWRYETHISVVIPSRKMSLIEALLESDLVSVSASPGTKATTGEKAAQPEGGELLTEP